MRASDRDRELATEVLREAYAEGRFDLTEFLKRVDASCSAKTWGELADLTADLPTDRTLSPGASGDRRYYDVEEMRDGPRHPFAPLWWVAVAWLAVAAVAHVAAAVPLVVLSLFVLGVALRSGSVHGSSARRSRPRPKAARRNQAHPVITGRAAGSARPRGRS